MTKVQACPECGETGIELNSSNRDSDAARYRCDPCGAHFEEYVLRDAKGNTNGLHGLAGKLYRGEVSRE
jgi:transposase-like protein